MTGSPKCLGYFLECNGDSLGRYWSCKAHANLKVVNHKDPSKSLERSISHLFYFKQNEYGYKVEGKIDKFWDFKLNIQLMSLVAHWFGCIKFWICICCCFLQADALEKNQNKRVNYLPQWWLEFKRSRKSWVGCLQSFLSYSPMFTYSLIQNSQIPLKISVIPFSWLLCILNITYGSTEYISKQPTQLIVQLKTSLRQIIDSKHSKFDRSKSMSYQGHVQAK